MNNLKNHIIYYTIGWVGISAFYNIDYFQRVPVDNNYTKGQERWLLQFNTNNNCLRVIEWELVAFMLCWTKLSMLNFTYF